MALIRRPPVQVAEAAAPSAAYASSALRARGWCGGEVRPARRQLGCSLQPLAGMHAGTQAVPRCALREPFLTQAEAAEAQVVG